MNILSLYLAEFQELLKRQLLTLMWRSYLVTMWLKKMIKKRRKKKKLLVLFNRKLIIRYLTLVFKSITYLSLCKSKKSP